MMHEESQIEIPPSFIELFITPGRTKPNASWATVAQRYELCEDLAQMLTDTASTQLVSLGISERDVLERCYRGLLGEGAVVSEDQARWVVRRLAELLGWPYP